jgi:FtsP/CotA-like multicopper oxidase with cupredoxin domain
VYDDGGSRFTTTFVSGTKYLIRLVNAAIDTHFKFSIDGHTLTVIGADFVPITPYTTEVLSIGIGQYHNYHSRTSKETHANSTQANATI